MSSKAQPLTEEAVERELEKLPALSRRELLKRFEQVYLRKAPMRLSDRTLQLAIAYRLQEQVYGGLKPAVRKALLAGPQKTPSVPTGTVLIREWHGERHMVTVHADRVDYAGRQYRSLSQVAFQITGHKRNGPDFFGMRSKANGR